MRVYLRRTGYYSHERIQDIQWINHIDWFSVNCTRESLPTSRPSWDRSSSEYLIIQALKDCLSDIELVYRILGHGSRIPGLPEAYSRAFPRSEMNFRHTSKALCCRVCWSQIWHCTHIPFNGQTYQPPLIIIICSHSQARLCTIHFAPFERYFLTSWMLWICSCQHTPRVIFQTRYF